MNSLLIQLYGCKHFRLVSIISLRNFSDLISFQIGASSTTESSDVGRCIHAFLREVGQSTLVQCLVNTFELAVLCNPQIFSTAPSSSYREKIITSSNFCKTECGQEPEIFKTWATKTRWNLTCLRKFGEP